MRGRAPTSLAEWSRVARAFDERLCVRRIAATWKQVRWSSTRRLLDHAETVAGWMRRDGLHEVEVLRLPADGRTAHGGWVLPLAWSPRGARLEVLAPADGGPRLLADWRTRPHHLALWSAPTPEGGVTAELVAADAPPRGRIVLLDGAPKLERIIELQRAGALGIVTDWVRTYPGIRDATEVDEAVSYLNWHQPQWQVPAGDRGFGFGITPAMGRRLRALLARGPVCLHATVDTELGEGELPVITGRLPGRSGQEILVTGHIDEPGANDNASGPMLGLSIGRMLAGLARRGWKPERGLRFLFSVEVRALNALINTQPRLFRNAVWGLNLDMLGCDQREVRSTLEVAPNPPPLPDPILPLVLKTMPKARGFRWKLVRTVNDNAMGDPAVGVPTTVLEQAPDVTYHTSLDVPARLSAPAVGRMGRWVGALVGHLCSAGPREITAIARLDAAYARKRLAEIAATAPATLGHQVAQERRRLDGLRRWIADGPFPFAESVRSSPPLLRRDGLSEAEAARQAITALAQDLRQSFPVPSVPAAPAPAAANRLARDAARLVPQKTYRGFFSGECLESAQRQRLEAALGEQLGWGAPTWLDWALFWSTGKQTLAEIGALLAHERRGVPLERLVAVFRCLADFGFVRFRPHLNGSDLVRSLRAVGVRPGMLLMVHSSLSGFGYIADGANTCITALRTAIGPRGTLAMPTHSLNVLGKPVYDPATSPSLVGAVTEVFRKLPGAVRSPHPTHSVAAMGPLATSLTQAHLATMAPLARDGFWGRFVDHDGWVLMMSPSTTNTLMHAAELWSGLRLPDVIIPLREGGRRRTGVVPNAPWHVNWFPKLYAALERAGQLRTASLGEGTIQLMRGRDVVAAGLALFRQEPLLVVREGCRCAFCAAVRSANPA